jgi:beta-1,4-mannosyltransferase
MRILMLPGRSLVRDNPYLAMLVSSLPASAEVVPFSWRAALLDSYDVLHVHWPERLLRASGPLRPWLKLLAFELVLLRARLRRVALVQTVHNLAPHEPGDSAERLGLRHWASAVTLRIYLNDAGAALRHGDVIKHGDYLPYLEELGAPPVIDGRGSGLLLFGHLKPYKGIEDLIEKAGDAPDIALRVLGAAYNEDYGREIEEAASLLPNVLVRTEALDDARLIEEIRAAGAVVLPYKDLYNSGAALLALSVGTPVILSDSESARELQSEVGRQWVRVLPVGWTADDLRRLLSELSVAPRRYPALSASRSWAAVGIAHVASYERARALARGPRRSLLRNRRAV